jgi:hypothetical protein
MKLNAELAVVELIGKDEEEKDGILKLSCEGLDASDVILEFGDLQLKVDGTDLMECLARISSEGLTTKKDGDD